MRKGLIRKALVGLFATCLLASCDLSSMFGYSTSSADAGVRPHAGHYLFDLYSPTQNRNPGVRYARGETTLKMDNKDVYEAFLFETLDSEDTTVTFNIDQGKYKTLCFVAGLAENYFSHYDFNSSCAFSVWNGNTRIYEDMFYALGPSKYVSVDISTASSLTFFVSHQFAMDCFGVGEVTLWEDANHSIAPAVQHADKEEDFLDNTYFVYGDGSNGADTWEHLDDDDGDSGYFKILGGDKYALVDNERITKGVAFTTATWFDDTDCKKFVINAMGRYQYLHFNLGHIDTSKTDGSVYLKVSVDRTVKLLKLAKDDDLPHDITIPLNYGKIVTFEVFPDPNCKDRKDMFSYGNYCIYNMIGSPNESFPASSSRQVFDGSYKLISEVGKPFSIINQFSNADTIMDGKTSMAGIQMCGVLYSEGLRMKSIYNILTSGLEAVSARASFNLHGAFDFLTFKVGRRDKSALVSEKLNIYLDDNLVLNDALSSMGAVKDYEVRVTGGKKVTFEIVGTSDTYRGFYGIVDIGVHTGAVRPLSFDHRPVSPRAAQDDCVSGQKYYLMRDILPYESFSKQNEQDILTDDRNDTAEYTTTDGRGFEANGSWHSEGVVLQTGTYASLGGGGASIAMGAMFVGFVLLVPMGMSDVNCASLAAFNLRDKFSTLSFKVAPTQDGGKMEKLSVVTPDGMLAEYDLDPMGETTCTLSVDGVSEFMFFLSFTDSGSVPFGFYDMELTAK